VRRGGSRAGFKEVEAPFRCALWWSANAGEEVFPANHERRIAAAEQYQIQEQAGSAAVAIVEEAHVDEPAMRRFRGVRRGLEPGGKVEPAHERPSRDRALSKRV